MNIQPFPTLEELYDSAAEAFCQRIGDAVGSQGICNISLSGGSTPKRLYEILAKRDLPWDKVHWFWGDERNVPHDDDASNFKMVREAILKTIGAKEFNVHPVPVNPSDPAASALGYEATLREHFAGQPFPRWDLALLGMGDDAHTASLFPGTRALAETSRWFVENWVEKFDAYRYTLTAPAINSAVESWFLVTGSNKSSALGQVTGTERDPSQFPAQLIAPTRWFVTSDAMSA